MDIRMMDGLPQHAQPMSKVPPAHMGRGSFNMPYPPNFLPSSGGGQEDMDTKPVITMITPNIHHLLKDEGKGLPNPVSMPAMLSMQNNVNIMSSLPMSYFPSSPPFSYQSSLSFPQMRSYPMPEKIEHVTPESPPSDNSENDKHIPSQEVRSTPPRNQTTKSSIDGPSPFFHCAEPGCSKVFTTAATLSKHVQTHTGERPFECHVPFCGKSFKTATYLTRHLKVHNIHTTISPEDGETLKYKCTWDGCERSFQNKHALHRHMDTHSTDRPFTCHIPNCGKTFKTKGSLKQHGKCHPEGVDIDQTPFKCTSLYCGKAFNTKGQLKIHLETHLYPGLRPYECTVQGCSKAFKSKGSLRQHEVCHRDDRPYMCPCVGCPKTFKTAICRDQHVKTHKSDFLLSSMSPPPVSSDLTLSKAPWQQTPKHLMNCIVTDQRGGLPRSQPMSPEDAHTRISMEQSLSLPGVGREINMAASNRSPPENIIVRHQGNVSAALAEHGGRIAGNEHLGSLPINHFMPHGLGNIAIRH